jgi:alkylation response protein AidB-like acyl-CoA dehydrogenase
MCAELLPAIAAGTIRPALALLEGRGSLDAAELGLRASDLGDGRAKLDGKKNFVLDGHTADRIVVLAREASGLSAFVVDGDATGLTRTAVATLDPTRKQAQLTFEAVEGRRVGQAGRAGAVHAHVLQRANVLLAAESVGCASACVEMSVEYAKNRVQFGRLIGSFQAVKHKCADMWRLTELARAAAYEAAAATSSRREDAEFVAAVAKAYCGETAAWVAGENIHVHGGIGYTWEHPAHLYFRRASSNELLFGGPGEQGERILAALGV